MPTISVNVEPHQAGKRIDLFLVDILRLRHIEASRNLIQKLIAQGTVVINDRPVKKPHHKIKDRDRITVSFEERKEQTLTPEQIPLDVMYEDDDLAIIDKPCGLVVHPAPGNQSHTLVNALLHRFNTLSDINPHRPGIVHRLDKDTSGLIVIAKNNAAHRSLAKQFANHTIRRTYVALVRGRVEFDENVIDIPVGRHPFKRKNMAAGFGRGTRSAKTYYRTLTREKEFSLLQLQPFTGRTHQLRVHLAFIGHPILGDPKYGKSSEFHRLALHAISLGFIHPRTQQFLEKSTDLPSEFQEYLQKNKRSDKPRKP